MANSRDRQILNSIVNPLLPIGEGVYDLEGECFESSVNEDIPDTEETRASKSFEKQGVACAERGRHVEAIALFGQGILDILSLVCNFYFSFSSQFCLANIKSIIIDHLLF